MKVVWVSSGDCDWTVIRPIVDGPIDLQVAAIDDVARRLSRGDCAVVFQFRAPTPVDLFRLQGWKARYPSIPFLLCVELSNAQLALWALRAGIWGLYVVPRDLMALRDAVGASPKGLPTSADKESVGVMVGVATCSLLGFLCWKRLTRISMRICIAP